jgi:hypothetical protein
MYCQLPGWRLPFVTVTTLRSAATRLMKVSRLSRCLARAEQATQQVSVTGQPLSLAEAPDPRTRLSRSTSEPRGIPKR